MDPFFGVDNAFLQRLEKILQEHENKIVVGLSMDRLIRFMGTNGIGALVIAAAAFTILGMILSKRHFANIIFNPIILLPLV